ncbi:MAG: hypothetical protein ABXS91_10030 [Sulfurimonas sp.]
MTIPIYDESILPCITFPLENTHQETKRYLGGKAITGEAYASISLIAKDDNEAKALYDFWVTDCNYGLEPFLIPLPVFGRNADTSAPALLVKFIGDAKDTKVANHWTAKRKLKILGAIHYVIDDQGQFVVDDAGDYIITDSGEINTYKEVIYGNS